jgi:hypothetical protein
LDFTPAFMEAFGPNATPTTGTLSGSINLTLNTIKTHFGIGDASKITGMRMQISPVVTAWSERGSATGSLVNIDDANQVVPEPSTYALLLVGAGAVGAAFWRRRRA